MATLSPVNPAEPRRPSSLGGLLQVCAAGFLWGTGGLVVTLLHDRGGWSALPVSAWRMLLATVALGAFALATRRRGAVRHVLTAHPALAITAGCGTALYQGLYFISVLLVGVSVATVVSLGLAPVLAAGWEHVVARTRPAPREVAVLASALTGLVLISLSAGHGTRAPGDRPGLGLALAVASGATYAGTTVLGHHLSHRVDPVALTACATAAGAVALAPFLLVAALGPQRAVSADPVDWALLAYLGVVTMALAYGLLYAGLRTTSGSAATVATLVEPLSAALLAALVLGERMGGPALLGGALILAAVVALRPVEENPAPA